MLSPALLSMDNISYHKLPKALHNLLVKMVEDYTLTTWNISGGQHFTSITIRFDTAAMMDTAVQQVKYKRVSQHQMARDRQRAAQWRTEDINVVNEPNFDTLENKTNKLTNTELDTSSVDIHNKEPILISDTDVDLGMLATASVAIKADHVKERVEPASGNNDIVIGAGKRADTKVKASED